MNLMIQPIAMSAAYLRAAGHFWSKNIELTQAVMQASVANQKAMMGIGSAPVAKTRATKGKTSDGAPTAVKRAARKPAAERQTQTRKTASSASSAAGQATSKRVTKTTSEGAARTATTGACRKQGKATTSASKAAAKTTTSAPKRTRAPSAPPAMPDPK
jgi:hypothetical protein